MALALAFIFALLTGADAQAGTCDCERFRDWIRFDTLAEQVGEIGTDAIQSDGRAFSLRGRLNEALRLKVRASYLIPEQCREELLAKSKSTHLEFMIRGSFANESGPTPFQVDLHAASLKGVYESVASASACSPPPPSDNSVSDVAAYIDCVRAKSKNSNPSYTHFYDLPDSVITGLVSVVLGVQLTSSDVKVLRTYNQLLNSSSAADLLRKISAKNDGLSSQEFLSVVKIFGDRFLSDYDYNRAAQIGPTAKGSITGDQLLSAAKNNVSSGTDVFIKSPLTQIQKSFAGVCRDIATFEAQMLLARGFKNTYVVAFAMPSDFHATVITQDPKSPRQLYLVNYGDSVGRLNQDGPSTLLQEWSDVSLNYVLYKPGAGQTVNIASEFGKFLTETAGFDVKNLDPLARTTNDLTASSVVYGAHGQGSSRILIGSDINGARYAGAASDYEYSQNENLPGKIGVVALIQQQPTNQQYGGNSLVVYGQVEQHLKTNPIALRKNLGLTLDSRLTVMGVATFGLDGDLARKNNQQGEFALNLEARLDGESGRLRWFTRAGAEFVPGMSTVQDPAPSSYRPEFNRAYAEVSGVLRFKDASLMASAIAVADLVGWRGRATVGVVGDRYSATAFVSGRITQGSALFEDQSLRRAGASVTVRPNRHVNFSVTGEVPVEGDDILRNFRLFGNLSGNY